MAKKLKKLSKKAQIILIVVGCAIALLGLAGGIVGITTAIQRKNCNHIWNEGEVKIEATCANAGEFVYECTECGEKKKEEIAQLEHSIVHQEAVPATCEEAGRTDAMVCELCGYYEVEPVELKALGHVHVQDAGKKESCLIAGITYGSHCARCDKITVAQEVIPATGHHLVKLESVAPTCTEKGLSEGCKCEYCGVVYVAQVEIPMLEHVDKNADLHCDECGVSMNVQLVSCAELCADGVGVELGEYWYRFETNAYVNVTTADGDYTLYYGEKPEDDENVRVSLTDSDYEFDYEIGDEYIDVKLIGGELPNGQQLVAGNWITSISGNVYRIIE